MWHLPVRLSNLGWVPPSPVELAFRLDRREGMETVETVSLSPMGNTQSGPLYFYASINHETLHLDRGISHRLPLGLTIFSSAE